ncbi:unnamed protein product, partial [Amoebophrya sp. A25]
ANRLHQCEDSCENSRNSWRLVQDRAYRQEVSTVSAIRQRQQHMQTLWRWRAEADACSQLDAGGGAGSSQGHVVPSAEERRMLERTSDANPSLHANSRAFYCPTVCGRTGSGQHMLTSQSLEHYYQPFQAGGNPYPAHYYNTVSPYP